MIPSSYELIANAEESSEGKEIFDISFSRAQPDWAIGLNELKQRKKSKRTSAIVGYILGLGVTGGSTYCLVAHSDDFTYSDADFLTASTFLTLSIVMNYVATRHLLESREYGDQMASYEQSVIDEFRAYLPGPMQDSLGSLVDFAYAEAGEVDLAS